MVTKAHALPSVFIASYLRFYDVSSKLFLLPCLCLAHMDSKAPKQVVQLDTFFYKLPRSWCFATEVEM